MSNLRLHRDEPEQEPPAPLPFGSPDRSWRRTDEQPDSIEQVERALANVESRFEQLRKMADEIEPIRMSEWLDDDDDGPWAA